MQPGDTVMTVQYEASILHKGEEPTPGVPHWVYATVFEVLKDDTGKITAATIEINHPANILHGQRMLVPRYKLRTAEDVQALVQIHPAKDVPQHQLNLNENPAHREINNHRAALERMTPPKAAA
jgi:hypothetical protein